MTNVRLEYAGAKLDVPDVDEASSAFVDAFSLLDVDAAFEVQHVAPLRLLGLGGDEKLTSAQLYDVMLRHWVASLPQDVPVRVRQAKERLARRISAEVMLASARIRERHMQGHENVSESQDGGQSLPILSSQPVESSQLGTLHHFSSQALPTPPLSLRQSSSQLSSFHSEPTVPTVAIRQKVSNPLERLSKHLRFRDDTVNEVPIKPNVSQLLAQWQLRSDPHAYNWEATEHVVYDNNLDEASQEQREKERRQKARRERKQQRENELIRLQSSSQTFTFAKPVPLPRSSPGPMIDAMANSSQVPVQTYSQVPLPGTTSGGFGGTDALAAQSQVEPGRFGGRPDKKKKKKRMGGF